MTADLLTRPARSVPDIVDAATRREFLAGLTAAGLLAACGDGGDGAEAVDIPATRTVDHALGTTEVPVEPQRVVAVTGTEELDALVALDVVPVAAAELELGVGFSEQADPFLGEVAMLPTRREINAEEVATHRPDLIIGTAGWVGDVSDQLSGIAPTVAIEGGRGWRDTIRQVAMAVGRVDRGEAVIDDVDAQIDALVEQAGARFDGTTYSLVKPFPSEGEYGLYRLEYDVEEILQRLGMVRPQDQLDLFSADEPGYAAISTEQVELLDTDAVFLFGYDDEADRAAIEETRAAPLFARLPAAAAGRVFTVDSANWYFSSSLAIEQVLADLDAGIIAQLIDKA